MAKLTLPNKPAVTDFAEPAAKLDTTAPPAAVTEVRVERRRAPRAPRPYAGLLTGTDENCRPLAG